MNDQPTYGPGAAEVLKDASTHFAFGDNWSNYSRLLNDDRISVATAALARLVGPDGVRGKTFLDIGCGSGLHSLAALRLGGARILSTDLDPMSVATTKRVLTEHHSDDSWSAEVVSVFDLDPVRHGTFDVVYSWGVLHHTGAMHEAITKAAAMVNPRGLLVIALYRKTRLCGFWRVEKRIYSRAPRVVQRVMRWIYLPSFALITKMTGGNFREHVRGYEERGMDFHHDVHDWLGGYPYESIATPDVHRYLSGLGFGVVREFTEPGKSGVLGSGCDEYVFRKLP